MSASSTARPPLSSTAAPAPTADTGPTATPTQASGSGAALWAIADLHLGATNNRPFLDALRPVGTDDWLLVVGDVAERADDVEDALRLLAQRFVQVVWVPGNHELWAGSDGLAGEELYRDLVARARRHGVLTPEDPYPLWPGGTGTSGTPLRIVPLFCLYDYTWRPEGCRTAGEALAMARRARVVASDEAFLDPSPHPSRAAWCAERLAVTTRRLASEIQPGERTILVSHWPLTRDSVAPLRFPEFALWCGTEHTEHWPRRYRAEAVVTGHLHIPSSRVVEGIRFEEWATPGNGVAADTPSR